MEISINDLHECPSCHNELHASQLHCSRCDITISGKFDLGRFQRLSPEQAEFLEAFLRCRGVIRDIEAALGISYPTVRSRLDNLLTSLGLDQPVAVTPPAEIDVTQRRKDILSAISEGRIDAAEGLRRLEELKNIG